MQKKRLTAIQKEEKNVNRRLTSYSAVELTLEVSGVSWSLASSADVAAAGILKLTSYCWDQQTEICIDGNEREQILQNQEDPSSVSTFPVQFSCPTIPRVSSLSSFSSEVLEG